MRRTVKPPVDYQEHSIENLYRQGVLSTGLRPHHTAVLQSIGKSRYVQADGIYTDHVTTFLAEHTEEKLRRLLTAEAKKRGKKVTEGGLNTAVFVLQKSAQGKLKRDIETALTELEKANVIKPFIEHKPGLLKGYDVHEDYKEAVKEHLATTRKGKITVA